MEFKVPREIEVAHAKEIARFENTDEDTCPLCKAEYKLTEANGHAVKACIKDRVIMPVKTS